MTAGKSPTDLLRAADTRRDLDPLTKALVKALRDQLAANKRAQAENADMEAKAIQTIGYANQMREWLFGEAIHLVKHAREQLQDVGCTVDVLTPSLQSLDNLLQELRLRAVPNDRWAKAQLERSGTASQTPPAAPRAPGTRLTRPRRAALDLIAAAERRGEALSAAELASRLNASNTTHRETARNMGADLVSRGFARMDDTGRLFLLVAK